MKLRLIFPWLCVLASLAGLAVVYSNSQKQATELAALRSDSEQLQKLREQQEESKQTAVQAVNEELVRLRKDHEELMRLRNEVRQLRGERQQLAGQVQSAQAAVQNAQAQADAQAQALKAAQALPGQAPGSQVTPGGAPSTPEMQAAFKARYGLAATPEQANAAGCVNNLRQIDGAKQQWALEKGKPAGGLLTAGDLAPYLPSKTLPSCPAGGVYTLNPVGIEPLCNIPGHALPK
jgi:hypothetical protein